MSNKMNSNDKKEAVISTCNQDVAQKTVSQKADDKRREEFTEFVFDAGQNVYKNIKENVDDYKAINEDPNMSSVDKALGKRKVIAADIGIGTLLFSCMIGLAWVAKKVF